MHKLFWYQLFSYSIVQKTSTFKIKWGQTWRQTIWEPFAIYISEIKGFLIKLSMVDSFSLKITKNAKAFWPNQTLLRSTIFWYYSGSKNFSLLPIKPYKSLIFNCVKAENYLGYHQWSLFSVGTHWNGRSHPLPIIRCCHPQPGFFVVFGINEFFAMHPLGAR